jgi:propanol-preferring alcohol dehydrogenase
MTDLPDTMRAMVLEQSPGSLKEKKVPVPDIEADELLIRVQACGVCRTDLHIIDGELEHPKADLIPGHEIVGKVVKAGEEAQGKKVGMRVGIPWLASTCGTCRFCRNDKENLCENAEFTGYTVDGGYAEYTKVRASYCYRIDPSYGSTEATPLLCAGLIGSRTYRMTGAHAHRIGIYGFGAAAHLIAQLMLQEGKKVFAFSKPGDEKA